MQEFDGMDVVMLESCLSLQFVGGWVQWLNLASNDINDESVGALAKAIAQLPRLKVLNLEGNIDICSDGAKKLAKSLAGCVELESLNVGGCGIGSVVVELSVLFCLFLFLKLGQFGEVANWSWWWVTAPLWIPLSIALIIFAVIGVVLVVNTRKLNKN